MNSLSANIPPELLAGAVRCGVITFLAALALARQCPMPERRVDALLALVRNIPREQQPGVLDEALSAARGLDDARSRAAALAAVAERLPAEEQPNVFDEALSAARGIDDAWRRARALAAVAERLPAEEQPDVLGEALSAARGIDDAGWRAKALAAVAERVLAGQISESSRDQWIKTVRVLGMRTRSECVDDLKAILSFIDALGDGAAVRSLGRSITSVGRWWP